jgi:cytochrome c
MKSAFAALTAMALGLPSGAAVADDELYKTKNCFACHRIDRNHLGPSFKAIAAKYAEDKTADARLATKIREGGVGVWGQVPMPAQAQVTEAEAMTLARWILEQK